MMAGTVYKMLDRQGELITELYYTPISDDLIRVDETEKFYRVSTVDPQTQTCVAVRSLEAERAYQ